MMMVMPLAFALARQCGMNPFVIAELELAVPVVLVDVEHAESDDGQHEQYAQTDSQVSQC
jgi:hypothetical protein